jgi:hypothetical protein
LKDTASVTPPLLSKESEGEKLNSTPKELEPSQKDEKSKKVTKFKINVKDKGENKI